MASTQGLTHNFERQIVRELYTICTYKNPFLSNNAIHSNYAMFNTFDAVLVLGCSRVK
jgi:diphthamide synthase subunit DPH2